jgi:hypothetical protein
MISDLLLMGQWLNPMSMTIGVGFLRALAWVL